MALTRGRDPRHRTTPQVRDDVQLRTQPTPRPPKPFPIRVFRPSGLRILVLRLSPPSGPSAPTLPPRHQPGAPCGHRPRAGGRAPPWHPPRRSTRPARHCHSQLADHRAPAPRCRPPTTGGAGCRRSSSCRRTPAGPATEPPHESATERHRSPSGGRPTAHPGAVSGPAETALTGPIPHRSSHDDHACPGSTAPSPKSLAGHALVPGGRNDSTAGHLAPGETGRSQETRGEHMRRTPRYGHLPPPPVGCAPGVTSALRG